MTATPSDTPEPFGVLGLSPTLDGAEVKRAYFAALQRHPPHLDPAGFQRVRQAYEALRTADALARAFAVAPLDVPSELARWTARFGAALEAARSAPPAPQPADPRELERVIARLSRLPLAEAVRVTATPATPATKPT
jgi:curved DNA-binding protein CbpA